jgi:hypothetical protein
MPQPGQIVDQPQAGAQQQSSQEQNNSSSNAFWSTMDYYHSDGSGKAPNEFAKLTYNFWNYTAGLGRGIIGFKGDDYYDRGSIFKQGMRVGNQAVPLALQADGMFGTPEVISPKYAVSFNGVAAQTTTVEAGSSLFSGTAGSIAGSSQLNVSQQNSSGSFAATVQKVEDGEQFTKADGRKALKPNVEYSTNEGYKFTTDSNGRISSAEANLKLGKADRNQYAQRTVGGEDRLPNDDGGHLIASIFKGSGEIDNLVPMNSTLNRSEYRTLENTWKNALMEGKTVNVKINPIYEGTSVRPSEFKIDYTIDGKKFSRRLTN